jgi:RNA polymerase sigma-70 factor, ECF subfamily
VSRNLSVLELGKADNLMVIALAMAKDRLAFDEVVKRFQSRVRGFMHRLCNKPDLADDLAQQAFLKAWNSISQLKNPGAFYGWLNRVMVTVWIGEVRRRKLEIIELDESAIVEAPRQTPGERVDLDAALSQLPAAMRLCLVLAYNNGLSHQEIADSTNIPLGTVKTNISRGTARLRVLLSDYRKQK